MSSHCYLLISSWDAAAFFPAAIVGLIISLRTPPAGTAVLAVSQLFLSRRKVLLRLSCHQKSSSPRRSLFHGLHSPRHTSLHLLVMSTSLSSRGWLWITLSSSYLLISSQIFVTWIAFFSSYLLISSQVFVLWIAFSKYDGLKLGKVWGKFIIYGLSVRVHWGLFVCVAPCMCANNACGSIACMAR